MKLNKLFHLHYVPIYHKDVFLFLFLEFGVQTCIVVDFI